MRRVYLVTFLLLVACGDRSGKTLDDPVFAPPATTTATVVPTTLPADPLEAPGAFSMTASWVDGSELPDRHTCVGDGISPALTWSNNPLDTVELALTVVDLDAGGTANWIVVGISVAETGMPEGQLPISAFEWANASGAPAWVPPCPPAGEAHRYEFTLHALNQQLEAADDAGATDVLALLDAITIARTSVSGVASN